ncbi:substrate-binding domain-containing protein [Nocardioides sp. SYSU D00065]|uniref:substrate-binding domain-containing protein n=1 Tax=Nocardioides sp. SYSU D00065 TaxID=2817378 RepID=UPI0027DDC6E9|nr:substrate-binding domain-containing protein [Nocardioides sp. SYSU D00065]
MGVTVYGEGNFINQGREGMEAYADARGIDLLWNSADGDVNTQANQVEQMITAGVDAIIIVPVQYDSLSPQLAQAQAADIPVVAVNTTIKETDLLASSVVPDDEAAGAGNARMLAEHLGGKGDVVILQCVLGSSYELARTAGMEKVFAEYPDIEVIAKGEAANNGRPEGAARMKNWLTAFDQIDGVASCGDDPGLGALQAMTEAGESIPITGVDGVADGLQAVKDGDFVGTMLQHGRVELATGLAVTLRLLEGEDVMPEYPYTMREVTKENVDAYMKHVMTESDAFVETLPDLVDDNLDACTSVEECDLSNENLPGE